MTRSAGQTLVAWLCLIAFGLGQTVFVGALVRCSDEHGGSRLEWGCLKSAQGACLSECDAAASTETDAQQSPLHPCSDSPLQSAEVGARAARSMSEPLLVAPPTLIGILPDWTMSAASVLSARFHEAELRAPDAIPRLRSVILLV